MFLEEGRFCSWETAQKAGAKQLATVPFKRTIGTAKPQQYFVTEKAPSKDDAAAWSRVAAVFVQGKEWQFRDWPFKVRLNFTTPACIWMHCAIT